MAFTLLNVTTVNRRDNDFFTVATAVNMEARVAIRRHPPTVPQFSGTLFPPREQRVSLQRANRKATETVFSDVNGYFEFIGWYPPASDYEFLIHGDDLYEPVIYPVDVPTEHRWNGRPDIVDSTDLS